MTIISKRAFRFNLRDEKKNIVQTAQVRPGIITQVPGWVKDDDLFKLAKKDGNITFVDTTTSQKDETPQGADNELLELRARAAELNIPRAGQLGRERLLAAIAEVEEADKKAKAEAEERERAEAEAKAKAEAEKQ